jgi:uncharacterized membrane protein
MDEQTVRAATTNNTKLFAGQALIIFIYSYWFFYISRILLSYFEIYASMTIFNLGLIFLALTYLVYLISKERYLLISINTTILLITGATTLLAFIPSVISTANYGLPLGLYFVAVFPVIFLLIAILFPHINKNNFQLIIRIFIVIFITNFFVSIAQVIGVQTGLIGLDIYFKNEYLQAIIFPGFDIGEDRLRAPGLFSNAGINGYFNSLLFIYILSQKGKIKIDTKLLILICMAVITIYLTLTRKVWLSLIFVYMIFLIIQLIFDKNLHSRITYSLSLIVFTLSALIIAIFVAANLDSNQALSSHSTQERLYEWRYYLNLFSNSRWTELLFGHGVLQAFFHETTTFKPVLIDNVFIAIFLYSGLFGLISYSLFWGAIGLYLGLNYKNSKFGFLVWIYFSFISLFSTFFADISTIMFAMTVFSICFSYRYTHE